MSEIQKAIRRILAQHYGNNWNDPRAQRWGANLVQQAPTLVGKQAGPFSKWMQTSMLTQ